MNGRHKALLGMKLHRNIIHSKLPGTAFVSAAAGHSASVSAGTTSQFDSATSVAGCAYGGYEKTLVYAGTQRLWSAGTRSFLETVARDGWTLMVGRPALCAVNLTALAFAPCLFALKRFSQRTSN